MADNNIPIPPNAGQVPEYDGDAAYRAYLNAVAPPIPIGQIQEFCPAEIPVRASLLRGDSAQMRNFSSRGFLLSPISITSSPLQIVQLIRAVSILLSLEPDWLRLPGNWLASDQMLFPQPNFFSIYVALRLEITVGPDGDSINQFEVEPADVESASLVIYHIVRQFSPRRPRLFKLKLSFSNSCLFIGIPLAGWKQCSFETFLLTTLAPTPDCCSILLQNTLIPLFANTAMLNWNTTWYLLLPSFVFFSHQF